MSHPFFDIPRPIVIGHRGCAGEAPENTLLAFERGLADGAAILETDVHVTGDGVPVLAHDPEVDRVTNGEGAIAALTLPELQRLDAGYSFSPNGDATHPFRDQGVRIPTFEEALKAFPGARFNVELKDPAPGAAAATLDVVRRTGRESLTLLTAGEPEIMQRLRHHIEAERAPVALGASLADIVDVVRSAEGGHAPETSSMALQIPSEFGGRPLVTPELITHAHAHGIQIHVWTINEVEEMTRLLELDVDGIVTDYPARLAELIAQR